ncbi:hypothetical protein BCR44DRAFT_1283809 [Catenaria anguillulae PL171]|uniref:Uncharacterized protein n=1 Tax=Catenaria anguillulae PL171 TaxID=765915 RepID=A0A1Y2HWC9_9FUNG|nr:hypothetical protein BCR44DRAFT_1283809 [Catenaria anguillulae PL171]
MIDHGGHDLHPLNTCGKPSLVDSNLRKFDHGRGTVASNKNHIVTAIATSVDHGLVLCACG